MVNTKKATLLSCALMAIILLGLSVSLTQAAEIAGSITADRSEIVIHQAVTLTCTYTSSTSSTGKGYLSISGPYDDPAHPDAFRDSSTIFSWDGYTTYPNHGPVLNSGTPVKYTKTLDATGYYKFKWDCGSSDGAYTWVIIHVVSTPTVLPEAPPLAVFALGFAAIGLFVLVTKRRTKHSEVTLS